MRRGITVVFVGGFLLALGSGVASAGGPRHEVPPGNARKSPSEAAENHANPKWASDAKRVLERAGQRRDGHDGKGPRHGKTELPNPNANPQWHPDSTRGQERAAERRPAHAGPRDTSLRRKLEDFFGKSRGAEAKDPEAKDPEAKPSKAKPSKAKYSDKHAKPKHPKHRRAK